MNVLTKLEFLIDPTFSVFRVIRLFMLVSVSGGSRGGAALGRRGPVLRGGAWPRHEGLRVQYSRRPGVPQHAAVRAQDGRGR